MNRESERFRPEESSLDDSYETQEGLSPLAIGYSWVVRITTTCFELVALMLFGRFVDARFGTFPVGICVGVALGLYVFIVGLISIVKRLEASDKRRSQNENEDDSK